MDYHVGIHTIYHQGDASFFGKVCRSGTSYAEAKRMTPPAQRQLQPLHPRTLLTCVLVLLAMLEHNGVTVTLTVLTMQVLWGTWLRNH